MTLQIPSPLITTTYFKGVFKGGGGFRGFTPPPLKFFK